MTSGLRDRVAGQRAVMGPVQPDDQAQVLGDFVGRALSRRLAGLSPEDRVRLVNEVLAALGGEVVEDGPLHLLAVLRPEAPGVVAIETRPKMALSRPALLTNAPDDPSLGSELRAELASADRVDLLCAFVKWYGLRVLEPELQNLRERGVQLRVITTTYMGATDRTALDRLARDFGAQVKINYEVRSTRLHAKAWLLHRESGYGTAYIGSSNLSRAALLDGLEWNVKLADAHTPELLAKFSATFETYWQDDSFVPYDPDRDGDRLDEALAAAGHGPSSAPLRLSGLQVRPYPHQQQILDDLERERARGHHRNLVVAATGTGKTVVAALDYSAMTGRPRLLFVAHRRELLAQALHTYREVLGDGAFGELWVDGSRPQQWNHVFASIQSISSSLLGDLPATHFEVVVVDEFHHAQAATYRNLLVTVQPRELLGLTATPERGDGGDVRDLFDGRTASELRLWDALRADLLCPFHYFGVADGTDLSRLRWRRGDYDVAELERVFTADDARVRIVLTQLRDKVDIAGMRALGFCVSVRHAEFMAARFRQAGVPALAVSGATTREDRDEAVRQLRAGEAKVLFAVDLFNEGLDIPEIDTLLLLRPTQSVTIFLQQLGRGLRRTPVKPVLTVLDFIGQQSVEFRFDLRLRALTGATRSGLLRQLQEGFDRLPSGCEVVLDRVAHRTVLDNVRRQLSLRRSAMVEEVRSHGDLRLGEFLAESGRELSDIYVRNGSWNGLRRAAGFAPIAVTDGGPLRRVGAFLHVDDPERAQTYESLLTSHVGYEDLSAREQRYARMLFFSVWTDRSRPPSYEEGLQRLRGDAPFVDEVIQLARLGVERGEGISRRLGPGTDEATLAVHARYSREEILAAIDYADLQRSPRAMQTGAVWSERMGIDALLVTLHKDERTHSPTTMYRDYALSPRTFHWESQNSTTAAGPTGVRYQQHRQRGSHVLLFVRETADADWDPPTAYLCLGEATYAGHTGERPMAITWNLTTPMPPAFFCSASVVA